MRFPCLWGIFLLSPFSKMKYRKQRRWSTARERSVLLYFLFEWGPFFKGTFKKRNQLQRDPFNKGRSPFARKRIIPLNWSPPPWSMVVRNVVRLYFSFFFSLLFEQWRGYPTWAADSTQLSAHTVGWGSIQRCIGVVPHSDGDTVFANLWTWSHHVLQRQCCS